MAKRPKTQNLPVFLAVLLLLSTLGSAFLLLTRNGSEPAIAARVIDGDTFTLTSGERVKLLGTDAPELGRCKAEESTKMLESLVMGKTLQITEEKRDTYGRRMGLVYAQGVLVNAKMLSSGLARPDYTKNSQTEILKAAYREAADAKRGIHSTACKIVAPKPPNSRCVIKGNIDKATWDHLYHLPSCRHYNQIVLDLDLGEQFFCSEDEAKEAGFRLAPDCLR